MKDFNFGVYLVICYLKFTGHKKYDFPIHSFSTEYNKYNHIKRVFFQSEVGEEATDQDDIDSEIENQKNRIFYYWSSSISPPELSCYEQQTAWIILSKIRIQIFAMK